MSRRALCLVGYPAEYFLPFGAALSEAGFEVHWVCALRADARYLVDRGVPARYVLDLTDGFREGLYSLATCREALARLENDTDPKFNDIILMDRLLREKDWRFSMEFLNHVARATEAFLQAGNVGIVSSWRDTAVQMTAMLVARRLGLPFVVPTRIRIPQEVYGFCSAHHTESFIRMREATQADVAWAEDVLLKFEARAVRPALKKASRTFTDVLKLMPSHWRAFWYQARRSFADLGNDYTRYPLATLVAMYVRRRMRLLTYKVFQPAATTVSDGGDYCLYALHTQPESSIDVQGSHYSDQLELIRHIARALPANTSLCVKVHPTDVDGKSLAFYQTIKAIPSVLLLDHSVDSRRLVEGARIVFALTGTIAYEAALMQKPVVVFARNFFNGLPTVHRCDSPVTLPSVVATILSEKSDESTRRDRRAAIVAFMADLRANCVLGEVSRLYGSSWEALRPSDLQTAVEAYARLHAILAPEPRQ